MRDLAKNFLRESDENKKLYVEGIVLKDSKALKKLEDGFNDYLFKTYLCSYVKKSIQLSSLKIKKKKKRIVDREKLCLNVIDVNFQEERVNSIPDKKIDMVDEICEAQKGINCIHGFSNERLSKAFNKLTNKEKEIVYKCIIKDKSQTNVAKDLGVSRQAINKIMNLALKKLSEELKGA